jgi:hypothetical protein
MPLSYASPLEGANVVVLGLHQPSGVSGEFNAVYISSEGFVLEASFYSPGGHTHVLAERWRYTDGPTGAWYLPAMG